MFKIKTSDNKIIEIKNDIKILTFIKKCLN